MKLLFVLGVLRVGLTFIYCVCLTHSRVTSFAFCLTGVEIENNLVSGEGSARPHCAPARPCRHSDMSPPTHIYIYSDI